MADAKMYSELYGHPDILSEVGLSFADLTAAVGNCANQATYQNLALDLRDRAPCVMAFVSDQHPHMITIAHAPRIYRGPLVPTGLVNPAIDKTVALIGNSSALLSLVVLPIEAFARANSLARDVVATQLAHLHAAIANHETHVEPVATDDATTAVVYKRVLILPCEWAVTALLASSSYLTFLEFYDLFIAPNLGDAQFDNVSQWWTMASSRHVAVNGDLTYPMAVDITGVGIPPNINQELLTWAARGSISDLAGLVQNNPGFAAVTNAIGHVTNAVADAEAQRAAEAAARDAPLSYSARFGAGVAQLVQRYTRSASDAELPEVHGVLSSYKERSRDMNTLNLAFYAASLDTHAINETNLPKCTILLLTLFRSHDLVGNSIELGDGLNPFSIVCQGHPNTKDALVLADRMATVESGNSAVSMSDAAMFKTKDGRFPHTYGQVNDKLWAFVLVVRVYVGPGDLSTTLVNSLTEVAPLILQLESLFHHNGSQGLMVAIRIMLYFQRLVVLYFRKARTIPIPGVVPLPDVDRLMDEMRMQSYDFLPDKCKLLVVAVAAIIPRGDCSITLSNYYSTINQVVQVKVSIYIRD